MTYNHNIEYMMISENSASCRKANKREFFTSLGRILFFSARMQLNWLTIESNKIVLSLTVWL